MIRCCGGMAYTWDDNGNLLSDGLRSYVYDRANRLTSVTQGSDTTEYAYNGTGDRVSETVNGVTNNFVLDLNTGLPQVLADDETTYLYGNGRIGQFAEEDSAYFLGDALGSVRQLVDEAGTVTLAKTYDPYGEVMSSVGAGASAYGYTGEEHSQSLNLLYLRARFYNPVIGRFQTKDTWKGDYTKPTSYNVWLYGYSNPENFIDPSGNEPIDFRDILYNYKKYLVGQAKSGAITDLEGLVLLSRDAALLTPTCTSCFVENLGAVLTGHTGSSAIHEVLVQGKGKLSKIFKDCSQIDEIIKNINYDEHYDPRVHFGQTGFDRIFQDPYALNHPEEELGGDQPHHFWFYVQVGYESGNAIGDIGVFLHETLLSNDRRGNSYEDVALGKEGVNLGILLMTNSLTPGEVGDYIQMTLSPFSAASKKWWYNKESFEKDFGSFWEESNAK